MMMVESSSLFSSENLTPPLGMIVGTPSNSKTSPLTGTNNSADNNKSNIMWRNSQPFYPPSRQLGSMTDVLLSPSADDGGIQSFLTFLEQVSFKGLSIFQSNQSEVLKLKKDYSQALAVNHMQQKYIKDLVQKNQELQERLKSGGAAH